MQEYLIFTGTVTQGLNGRDILRKKGIKADVRKVSGNEKGIGCGYAIVIKDNVRLAEEMLIQNGIKILKKTKKDI